MTTNQLALAGVTSSTHYPDGTLRECTLDQPNSVHTCCGDLVPRFSGPDERRKDLQSMSFYRGGAVRSIALEEQVILPTPLGAVPAELVAFHEDGRLECVFPLNGRLSFAWTEEDEGTLARPQRVRLRFGEITARLVAIRFYPTGELKSLLLWPGEVVRLTTPAGVFPARAGIRLHRDGSLASFEPAVPIRLRTPVGLVRAYDVDAVTMQGDDNSVRFDEAGNLIGFATSGEVIVAEPEGVRHRVSSRTRLALTADIPVKLPLHLTIDPDGNQVRINDGRRTSAFPLSTSRFLVLADIDTESLCPTSCDSCTLACA